MSTNKNETLKINITVDGKTVTATLIDNSASRDLVSRLPLKSTLMILITLQRRSFIQSHL